MPKQVAKTRTPQLKVGQRVVFRVGRHEIRRVLVEDRGAIGTGGRRLWRIRAANDNDGAECPPTEFEVPAEQVIPTGTSRRSARPQAAAKPTARHFAR